MSDITDSTICLGLAIARDLPEVEDIKRPLRGKLSYEDWKLLPTESYKRRPYLREVEVYSFPQGWGSTALGFGGIGGQSITQAQTTIVISGCDAAVYFARNLAYVIRNYNSALMADIAGLNIAECAKASKYRSDRTPTSLGASDN